MFSRSRSWLTFILCTGVVLVSALPTVAETLPDETQPDVMRRASARFFETHCADCHDGGADEGGFELTSLTDNLDDERTFALWERVHDRIDTGEMPPKEMPRPTDRDRAAIVRSLSASLNAAHERSKGTVLRRLNRREYQNTLNDLFGTTLDLESMLPEDGRSHEFDNVGSALNISMVQMQRYMEAADLVIETAIAERTAAPQPVKISTNYDQTREGERFIGDKWLKRPDGAVVFFLTPGYPTGMLRSASPKRPGRHRIRITGYAYQSDDPITFAVGATTFARGAKRPTFGYWAFKPGEPQTIEFEAELEDRYMLDITPWRLFDQNYLLKKNGVKEYPGPGLAILNVELEGPLLDGWPSKGHRLLFDGLTRKEIEPGRASDKKKPWYRPKFEIVSQNPSRDVTPVLQRIASHAFRRPVREGDIERYRSLFLSELGDGATFEEALKTATVAIFCSPEFLFLREQPGRLDDHALAARLAYFLTRTTPDDRLRGLADSGRLTASEPTLKAEVERLLTGPHAERFLVDFTDAWLNLRDIEFTNPDGTLFPEFDPFLQWSMLGETRGFLNELLTENLRVRNVVDSDFAMLNNRLAEHYGIEGVEGPKIRRVPLPSDSVRGGFLSQGAVLKVSANGTNTSPVVRGVWVMERILGQVPPPPPPGIAGVEPDIRGASTLRELLDKHRDSQSCRNCHAMIDPPGFALEAFNPIGGFRDRFRSLGEGERIQKEIAGRKVRYKLGQPVDASGELRDGRTFADFRSFKELLAEDEDALARAFVTKLLTFATGREMGFSDRRLIDGIVQESARKGHGVRDLIHLTVASEIFRTK